MRRHESGVANKTSTASQDVASGTEWPRFEDAADRTDHFVVRDGVKYAGTHLLLDLYGASHLDDLWHMDTTLRACVEACGATLLHIHLHHFTPNGGVSGVAVLAESHISVHTWPESDFAAFDVFMCGATYPERCKPVLTTAFQPDRIDVHERLRGRVDPDA
jgi:S-adenosylmethionine decarboxylase